MAKFTFQGRTSFLWKMVFIYFLMNIFYCSGQINLKPRTENNLEQKYSSLEHKDVFLSKLLPATSRSADFDHVTETRGLAQHRLGKLNGRHDRRFHSFGHFKDEISNGISHREFTKNKNRHKRAVSWRPTDLQNLKDVFFMVFNRTEMKMNKFANQLSQLVETANEKNRQLKMDFLPRLENIEQRFTLVHSVDCKEKDAERFGIFNNFSLEFNKERDHIRQELLKWSEIAMICKLPLDEPYGEKNETLLHISAQVDAAEAAKLLIRIGARIHPRTIEGKTPLHLAARNNSIQMLNLLIENHADVNATDNLRETALFEAAATDAVEAAQILIQNKANVNAFGRVANLAIHEAAYRNSVKVLNLLIQHKVSVNARSLIGPPLHQTTMNDAVEAAEILLENGANLTLPDYIGDTVLHRAAQGNCVKLMQLFLKKYKGPVNIRNGIDYTPLHWAAVKNSRAVAEILLENGADINSRTVINSTPLHLAAEDEAFDVLKLLLENKADTQIEDFEGLTPYGVARKHKRTQCLQIMKTFGVQQ